VPQKFSVIFFDDGSQVDLCSFVESEIHLPDLLFQFITK